MTLFLTVHWCLSLLLLTLTYCRQQSEKILRANLTLGNKLFYHTIYRAEQTATLLGLIVARLA